MKRTPLLGGALSVLSTLLRALPKFAETTAPYRSSRGGAPSTVAVYSAARARCGRSKRARLVPTGSPLHRGDELHALQLHADGGASAVQHLQICDT